MSGNLALASPQGQLTWGVHISLSPTWFDPAETPGIITPFMELYALHDAMLKPMPGNMAQLCLAESYAASEDALTYDFVLRDGTRFHNGEPVTAEDVAFSFQRYSGTSHELLKSRVAAVEVADPRHLSFRLSKPWPDFLTFYSSATGAGWYGPAPTGAFLKPSSPTLSRYFFGTIPSSSRSPQASSW